MISEDLVINCNKCDAWFADQEVNGEQCPRCSGQLRHAHEHNIQTPWQSMRAELVKHEIRGLKKRIEDLERYLIDYLGEDC